MNFPISRPDHIQPHHWDEWVIGSGVDPEIVALRIRSLSGSQAVRAIAEEAIAQSQKVTSYVTMSAKRILERYQPLENGGWWVSGLDPLNDWQPMKWGQFKPDTPRFDPENEKFVKYETPAKVEARAHFGQTTYLQTLKLLVNLGIFHGDKFKPEIIRGIAQVRNALSQQSDFGSLGETEFTEIDTCLRDIQGTVAAGEFRAAFELFQGALPSPAESNYLVAQDLVERRDRRTGSAGWTVLASLENPDHWRWVKDWGLPIVITEGSKKGAAIDCQGFAAIALPGISMGSRSKDKDGNELKFSRLIADLEVFATAGREVVICFDYETKQKTIYDIRKHTETLKRLFSQKGCTVKVALLPGPDKGVDDFIVAQGGQAFLDLYRDRLSWDRFQQVRFSSLTFKPTVELNQRYLGDLDIPEDARFVAIKSPKGTGKTTSFKPIVDDATGRGQKVFLISHRVQLAQAICEKIGLNYVSELRSSEEGALLGFGLCIDSLHPESQARFNAENYRSPIVIIDEIEQVVLHLLDANTEVAKRRTTILSQLATLLKNAAENGRIIVSDADLSDLSIDYLQGLLEQKTPPHLIVNNWRPEEEACTIYNYEQHKPDQWFAALLEEVKSGGKPFIVTQAQKAKSLWSTTTLENYLRETFPDKRWLRVDSETIADPSHEAYQCAENINNIVVRYDGVIVSPTLETGISIDVRGHFTSVWGCLNGVVAENSARQSLARLREPVDRHIWIAKRGNRQIGNGGTSAASVMRGEQQMAAVVKRLVHTVCYEDELLAANTISLKCWVNLATRINCGFVRYRETILAGLKEEGHMITDFDPNLPTKGLIQELKALKDKTYTAECEAIASSEAIDAKKADELKSKKAKTTDERHQERKHSIQERYQVEEVTPVLVAKDDDGWFNKLRLFYFLGMGRVFLQERDAKALGQTLETSGAWLPTLNRSQLSARIHLLEGLGIKTLLDLDTEFNGGTKAKGYENAHPALLKIAERCKANSWVIKTVLNVTVSETMSPIQIAQTLLGKIGVKLEFAGQFGGRRDRQRVYRYKLPTDGRNEILAAWFARDQSNQNQSEEVHNPSRREDTGRAVA